MRVDRFRQHPVREDASSSSEVCWIRDALAGRRNAVVTAWFGALPQGEGTMVVRSRRLLGVLVALVLLVPPTLATAQEQTIEPSFSHQLLATFGYPELAITQTPHGFEAPQQVTAGWYLVALTSAKGLNAYLNLVQIPAGVSAQDAGEQLLSAARHDTPVPGWTYGGGTYAIDGRTAWVLLAVPPGDWSWGVTSQPTEDNAEETPYLLPLSVTAGTPVASPGAAAPTPTVDVTMTEYVFTGLDGTTLPAGPQVWRFTNTGTQPHHMVLYPDPAAHHPVRYRGPRGRVHGRHPDAPAVLVDRRGVGGLRSDHLAGPLDHDRVRFIPRHLPRALLHYRHHDRSSPPRRGHGPELHDHVDGGRRAGSPRCCPADRGGRGRIATTPASAEQGTSKPDPGQGAEACRAPCLGPSDPRPGTL